MTEHEWLTSADPAAMLTLLRERASDRKLRLFAVASCRDIGPGFAYPTFHRAVDVAERAADGRTSGEELVAAGAAIRTAMFAGPQLLPKGDFSALKAAMEACGNTYGMVIGASSTAAYAFAGYACAYTPDAQTPRRIEVRVRKRADQASMLRDIFGNPFRPVTPDPSWLTSTVVGLASAIYDNRAFHDLPILADALQDSGCDDEAVLAHCRGEGPHARGCFALDLCLGKG